MRSDSKKGDFEIWARPLQGGGRAVVLLNRGAAPATIRVDWTQLDYPASTKAKVRDLWAAKDLGSKAGGFEAVAASHGVVMLKVQP